MKSPDRKTFFSRRAYLTGKWLNTPQAHIAASFFSAMSIPVAHVGAENRIDLLSQDGLRNAAGTNAAFGAI
ncbi:MAG: hypothetical protein HYV40_05080, partial [Candidatus Levybacteria bacterium]|nr:hypothetical protein [Candidatus Levybacteria bacterium]